MLIKGEGEIEINGKKEPCKAGEVFISLLQSTLVVPLNEGTLKWKA